MKSTLEDPVIIPPNSKIRLYPSGILFDPINTSDEDMNNLDVESIAHSLSMLCRFVGHCKFHYSIAQHAYYVSLLSGPFYLEGLHHDDSEGCGLVDLPRPVKYAPGLLPYREHEKSLSDKLNKKFNLYPMSESVKRADDQMLVAEMKVLAPASYEYYCTHLRNKGFMEILVEIEEWGPKKAKQMYLDRHYQLMKERDQTEINEEDGYAGVI